MQKRWIVRLSLWMCLIAGLAMSFWKVLDTRNTERVHEEAAQIAGLPAQGQESEYGQSWGSDDLAGMKLNVKITKTGKKAKTGRKRKTEPLPEEAAFLAEMNLEALQEINPDTAGWIAIPGTTLSYPLVQSEDNQFYLNHNWKKESNLSGAIFLECTNHRDFSDFHTLIYGHRMRDNSMFGLLKYYQNRDYWKEHPDFYVVVGGNICRYTIFAAHETSITGPVYRLDLEEKGLEEEFVRYCIDSSVLSTDSVPERGKKIVTLSTCTGRGHATRWVVQGYLAQIYSK